MMPCVTHERDLLFYLSQKGQSTTYHNIVSHSQLQSSRMWFYLGNSDGAPAKMAPGETCNAPGEVRPGIENG